jgi:hypothetical protein
VLGVLFAAVVAAAGDPVATALETAKDQLARHDEIGARKTLERALTLASDKPERLGEVYLYLGLAWAEGANEARAVESFGIALKLDRKLELPPGQAPKVKEWWKRAGGRLEAPAAAPPPVEAPPARVEPAPAPVAVAPPRVVVEEAPVKTTPRWWLVPAGLALGAAVVSGVLWQQSETRYSQLVNAPAGFRDGEAVASSGKGLQLGGWIVLSVAAALAITSLILLVLG